MIGHFKLIKSTLDDLLQHQDLSSPFFHSNCVDFNILKWRKFLAYMCIDSLVTVLPGGLPVSNLKVKGQEARGEGD